jgi:U3 small nucleolar RNA-associated protein 21
VDVVAVGLEDGRIILHNIRLDKTLFTFRQEEGAVTGITFRTDGFNIMATASRLGTVALWDLDKQKLSFLMRNVHQGAVTTTYFFAGEPLMFTSGADNSIKVRSVAPVPVAATNITCIHLSEII